MFPAHMGIVDGVAFSPDGKLLLTASGFNSVTTQHRVADGDTVRVWNVSNARTLLELRGHGDFVSEANFSRDGRRIVTASWDGTVRVYSCSICADVKELAKESLSVMATWSANA
jgi:WD40 repeat protein